MKNAFRTVVDAFFSVTRLDKRYPENLIIYIFLGLAIAVAELVFVLALAGVVNSFLSGESSGVALFQFKVDFSVLDVLFLSIFVGGLKLLQIVLTGNLSFDTWKNLVSEVHTKVLASSISSETLRENSLAFLTNKAELLIHVLVLPFLNLITSFLLIGVFLFYLAFMAGPDILIALVLVILLYAVISFAARSKLREVSVTLSKNVSALINKLNVSLLAAREVKLWKLERHFASEAKAAASSVARARKFSYVLSLVPRTAIEMLIYTLLCVSLLATNLSPSEYLESAISLSLMALKMLPAVQQAYYCLTHIQTGVSIASELTFYTSNFRREKTSQLEGEIQLSDSAKSITIKDLSFAYQDRSPLFSDFNLVISPGDKIAVIGQSGSGKSTLIDILSGLLVLQSGRLIIPSKLWDSEASITLAAYVGQFPYIFKGSVRSNVTLSRELDEFECETRLVKSLRDAGLGEFVFDENIGLDFQIDENGRNLSGGQRQRLAIARALYADRDLLLLDEITSSLDKETANQIINTILALDKTVLLITHDESLGDKFPVRLNSREFIS